MLIAQMTDIHIGFDPDAKPEELNRIRFRATLQRVLSSPNKPDLLVLSGDLTDHGDAESFSKIADLLRVVPCPILPLVGNHDTREELKRAFPDTPEDNGFLHYVVERDGLRIICLDSFEPGRHGGAFCKARRDWLKARLAEGNGMPCLIFMHHPPVVSGIDWMDPAADEDWIANFADAIAGHEQSIRSIHCGHLHRRLHTSFHGIPLGVTPSVAPLVALDLRPIDETRADNRALITTEPPSYALHWWDGENVLTHYESCDDWEVLAHYGEHLKPMIREMFAERSLDS
ncbi:metallophosphoesterase [Erythrobacter mangrovi]|uniref:Metallophosphoesterase n=1 Tax=Erythrobacter mangrovi TaxID=2739433 RepID=A0A7D4BBT0_9SPHN|nr:metallophosphoesterase [Erythrobacter mangrovi]QKG72146.1 metallophosphoesterase [Erythrobacter mangrovi]